MGKNTTSSKHRVELLHQRDPDAACSLELFIDGVEITTFNEYSIDAGAGSDWSDWVESRAEDIASASPVVASRLWAECVDPAGGGYIEGMPESVVRRERDLRAAVRAVRASVSASLNPQS